MKKKEALYCGRNRLCSLFVQLVNAFISVYNVSIRVVAQCVFLRAGYLRIHPAAGETSAHCSGLTV